MSPSSVAYQLKALEAKGFIRRDPNRQRAVDVRAPSYLVDDETLNAARPKPAYVPLVGRIAAGAAEVANRLRKDLEVTRHHRVPGAPVGRADADNSRSTHAVSRACSSVVFTISFARA